MSDVASPRSDVPLARPPSESALRPANNPNAPDSPATRPATVTSTSQVTNTAPAETEGKHSSGETSRIKKKQSDRLAVVKKRTLIVVIVADIVMLLALAFQMVWLNTSLHSALNDRVEDLMGFYRSRYNEKLTDLSLGATLYSMNVSTTSACAAIIGDTDGIAEMRVRLSNDARGRNLEIALVTDRNGIIISTGGLRSAIGHEFDPQHIVSDFYKNYPQTGQQLMSTVMIPRDVFALLGSPTYDAPGVYHPELNSWPNVTETLTRLVLTPLQCGTSNVKGYIIFGDAMTTRQYQNLNRLVQSTASSLAATLARTSDGTWVSMFSYNNPGSRGWNEPFPNLSPYFTADYLEKAYQNGGANTGRLKLGGIDYTFGTLPIQKQKLGDQVIDTIATPHVVLIHAEPSYAVGKVVNNALLWHVPFGLLMTIISFITLKFTFDKFLQPMRLLIESVKKKKLKDFNERIRQLKTNRSTIWAVIGKTLLIQCILLGLVFANRWLLTAAIDEFTSATTQGHIAPYIVASRTRSISSYLNAWGGFSSVITATATRNITSTFRAGLLSRFPQLKSDAIFLIDMDSTVLASSYEPAQGLTFPEVGIMEYYRSLALSDLVQFTSLTNWHPAVVNRFLPKHVNLTDPPTFIRLAVGPVNYLNFNTTDEKFVMGDLVGALVVVRVFNGLNSVWGNLVDAFGTGYYGLYNWDRVNKMFAPVTTLLQTDSQSDYTLDISETYPDLLRNGVLTSYDDTGLFVQQGVVIQGESKTMSVAPYFQDSDDVVLTPLMINGYQVTGVPQDRYDDLLRNQLILQTSIMAVEFLTSFIALLCTYWPMKKFLDNLEKAFNVASVSEEKRQKMEERAAAMITGVPAEPTTPGRNQNRMSNAEVVSLPSLSSSVRRSL